MAHRQKDRAAVSHDDSDLYTVQYTEDAGEDSDIPRPRSPKRPKRPPPEPSPKPSPKPSPPPSPERKEKELTIYGSTPSDSTTFSGSSPKSNVSEVTHNSGFESFTAQRSYDLHEAYDTTQEMTGPAQSPRSATFTTPSTSYNDTGQYYLTGLAGTSPAQSHERQQYNQYPQSAQYQQYHQYPSTPHTQSTGHFSVPAWNWDPERQKHYYYTWVDGKWVQMYASQGLENH